MKMKWKTLKLQRSTNSKKKENKPITDCRGILRTS